MRSGLRADTRWVDVELPGPRGPGHAWEPLTVGSVLDARLFPGWWRHEDGLVRTVVSTEASPPPAALAVA